MKRISHTTFIAFAMLSASATVASAQYISRPSISTGERIRVSAPAILSEVTTGTFLSSSQDTLLMSRSRGSVQLALPLPAIASLDVSAGRSRAKWSLLGATGGLLAGSVIGGYAGGHDDPSGLGALAGFVSGAIVGLVGGAVGGALLAPERWVPYPLHLNRPQGF